MRYPVLILILLVAAQDTFADEWTRFRGPRGAGISDDNAIPTSWSESQNLAWRASLPGPGSSSAIVYGKHVFVTCYSGYGVGQDGSGKMEDLQRHLVCIDRSNGNIVWSRAVQAVMPEDPYRGFITEHGYASSTPVTDGKRIFVFYGKTGVLAYNMDGKKLWQVNVGKESSSRRWGSAASLILYKDMVIVNAAEESQSIRALKQESGVEVWKATAAGLELAYGTPALVNLPNGTQQFVLAVPDEVWGLNADTGKLTWYVETALTGNISPTVMADGDQLYVFGGYRGSGSLSLRAGGKGDVTDSNVLWTSRTSSYVASPLLHDGHLYWVDDRGIANCMKADSGEMAYRERIPRASGGRPFYASLVKANDKLYAVSRRAGVFVLPANAEFAVIAQNRFADDETDFNATPAISNGQMFLRSNKFLYCVQNKK